MIEDEDFRATLERVARFASAYTPSPELALLAGSRARGTFGTGSDYDVILLYAELPQGAWREMTRFEGVDFEVFAHDLRSLAYFLREIELPSSKPVLASMVDEGVTVRGGGGMEAKARSLAREFLASGPLPLDEAGLAHRRYTITDLAVALHGARRGAERIAIGNSLYLALVNFVLQANGHWTAGGKALPAALQKLGSDLDERFTQAFESLYKTERDTELQDLVTDLLAPFGGRLRAGFRQGAPPTWR